jgi:hypothetical protein
VAPPSSGRSRNPWIGYQRQPIVIETDRGGGSFESNLTGVRREERLIITVARPTGLAKVTGCERAPLPNPTRNAGQHRPDRPSRGPIIEADSADVAQLVAIPGHENHQPHP